MTMKEREQNLPSSPPQPGHAQQELRSDFKQKAEGHPEPNRNQPCL